MKGNVKIKRNLNYMISSQKMIYEFSYFSKKDPTPNGFFNNILLASKFSRYAVNFDNFDQSDNYQN